MDSGLTVLAEVYPGASYGVALAPSLPTSPLTLAKTKLATRGSALQRLREAQWPRARSVSLPDLALAEANEDDFDALMTALALVRLVAEGRPLSCDLVDHRFEGGLLGTGAVNLGTPSDAPKRKRAVTSGVRPARQPHGMRCPVPGCEKVFAQGRLGWDAHAGSLRTHPGWHPEIRSPEERKERFREVFAEWFDD